MNNPDDFARAYAHLSAALELLDGLGLSLEAADVCLALERMNKSEMAQSLLPEQHSAIQ